MEKLDCVRCGICCMMGPCQKGIEGDDGTCIYLVKNKDKTTSCSLVLNKIVNPKEVGINGSGCVLRKQPNIYNYYKNQFKEG